MKFKAPQLICAVSALAFFLSNFLYVVNWIVQGYGMPELSFSFFTWPISFVFELAALVVFILYFKKPVIRNIAAGVFIAARLLYALYFMIDGSSISWTLKLFVGWPYWDSFGLSFLAGFLDFLSFIALVVAVVLSLINMTQIQTPVVGAPGIVPPATNSYPRPAQTPKPQHRYAEIEVLGDLLAKGLLTQDEFDQKKREILGLDK